MDEIFNHSSTTGLMLATLGGQPQVVTFALDALAGRGETIRDVVVIHLDTGNPRTRASLARLATEFAGDRYQGQVCRLRLAPVRLLDIRDEQEADVAWNTIHSLIGALKTQERPLHLCIAGGRRMLALLALSAAMLHFGHADRMWHLYTPDAFRQAAAGGAIMHAAPADGVRLIQAPLAPLGAYFPPIRALAATPAAAILAKQTQWLDEITRSRGRAVMAQLTSRQLDVLRAFAGGASPQEVAEQLHITLATVNTHKTAILTECRVAWDLPPDEWLDYHFLRDKFAPLFTSVPHPGGDSVRGNDEKR